MQEIYNQLRELSYNLYWSWNNDFYSIFDEINRDFWKWSSKNPVKFLESINHNYLFEIIEKKDLKDKIHRVYRDYRDYLNKETYFGKSLKEEDTPKIIYLSAEYGITKCLKFYSGGLGTLSGDHLKSASDLGVPLVGVGLAYLYGYFRQYINHDGYQSELYEQNFFESMPMNLALDEDYRPIKISIEILGKSVYAQIWILNIGKIKLYLLDTFVDENAVEDKRITDILYGGETDKRILQEILLGIGGLRAMAALNIKVRGCHMNEGHSAFLVFERIKEMMNKHNISFKEAQEKCYYSNVFTTHTPVPAGIDIFPRWLMDKYFRNYAEKELKISFNELFEEGDLTRNQNNNDHFNMAYLALNNSNFVNGVSKLHGKIARKMWALPETRSQIISITNGIHTKTYLSPESESFYRKNFGKNWFSKPTLLEELKDLPDETIWKMRQRNRAALISHIRERVLDKLKLTHESEDKIQEVQELLDDKTLTIGFARRFATYKRGTLIFRNLERLKKIISNEKMKVQFVFSGKAHPKDEGGKNLIAEIVRYTNTEFFKNKIVFIDNYDMEVAKQLVSGCDVWLNNPMRPLEASGTSGMKAVANGCLNFSILDGWWVEGYAPDNGWKIESPANIDNLNVSAVDNYESESMYNTLERDIIPLFYDRDSKGIPVKWVSKIKNSICSLSKYFNTERMVKEYYEMFYSELK
jgi:glycogen phosphorylase